MFGLKNKTVEQPFESIHQPGQVPGVRVPGRPGMPRHRLVRVLCFVTHGAAHECEEGAATAVAVAYPWDAPEALRPTLALTPNAAPYEKGGVTVQPASLSLGKLTHGCA